MKTRVINELFKQSGLPTLLLDEDDPEWHNDAFAALSDNVRAELLQRIAQEQQSQYFEWAGHRFELLISGRHRLLLGVPASDRRLQRRLLGELPPALEAGGDPWLNSVTLLGPLLGWSHCAGVKHKSASADDRLGYWRKGTLQPPQHLPLEHSFAVELYNGAAEQLLLCDPRKRFPDDPLLSGNGDTLCLAQRVDILDKTQQPTAAGYLCVWGKPDATQLQTARGLLPLAADLLSAYLQRQQLHANESESEFELPQFPTDDLTGLPGRTAFDVTLESFEAHYRHTQQDCLMAMLDINGLSAINNTQGIEFGDQLLRELAQQLLQICRRQDRVFRFGGDEFVLLLPLRGKEPPLLQRISQIEKEFSRRPNLKQFSVSLGQARLSETRGSSDDLMLLTDQRLREAKQQDAK